MQEHAELLQAVAQEYATETDHTLAKVSFSVLMPEAQKALEDGVQRRGSDEPPLSTPEEPPQMTMDIDIVRHCGDHC